MCTYFQTLAETRVKALTEFVRTLPLPSNMDALVVQVFGSLEDKRGPALRQSVQYYLNGTASGFLKYCSLPSEYYCFCFLESKVLLTSTSLQKQFVTVV